jgi:hypothetical protein
MQQFDPWHTPPGLGDLDAVPQQHQLASKPMHRQQRQCPLRPMNRQPVYVHGRGVEEIQYPVVAARGEPEGADDAADSEQVIAGANPGERYEEPQKAPMTRTCHP